MFDRVQAQEIMYKLKDSNKQLTTSKIRKLLSMVNEIYNDALLADKWDDRLQLRFDYFIIRMAYESGREKPVKTFIEEAELIKKAEQVKNRQDFLDFSKYLEALTAYHRFYGGEDY